MTCTAIFTDADETDNPVDFTPDAEFSDRANITVYTKGTWSGRSIKIEATGDSVANLLVGHITAGDPRPRKIDVFCEKLTFTIENSSNNPNTASLTIVVCEQTPSA